MATSRIESLPQELIAHIATFVEALSIIRLSRTSKTIRSAVYCSLTFREVLQNAQRRNWRHDGLDLDAIAKRAGNDVSTWARYAVADDQAWVLAGSREPLEKRITSIAFLPELAVVKHPFLKQRCWHTATHGPFDYLLGHVFCLAMAILSADDVVLRSFHDPGQCEYCYPKPRERGSGSAFLDGEGALWTLCSVVISLRNALKTRRSVWPYNEAANVPYIDCPLVQHIPLRPISEDLGLPVPFARRAQDILNTWIPKTGGWDDWYRNHNRSLTSSTSFLTDGSWRGYYTYDDLPLDPPMTQIRFKEPTRPSITEGHGYEIYFPIQADDCVDGVENFLLRGSLCWDGGIGRLQAAKVYRSGPLWHWDCRVTPFGLVGHWGNSGPDGFEKHGHLWLWKEEWMGEEVKAED